MIRLNPSEVRSSVNGGAFRTGRNAIRSIRTATTPPVRIAIGMNVCHGHPASLASNIAIPESVSDLAVGEVDQTEHCVHRGDPDREQGIDAPEREPVDDLLRGLGAGVGQHAGHACTARPR